jgi:hypothetical protein
VNACEDGQASRRVVIGIGLSVALVFAAGAGSAIAKRDHGHTRPSTTQTQAQTPPSIATPPPGGRSATAAAATAVDYYLALKREDPQAAYGLLCPARQLSYSEYAAEVATDTRTGTGITSFTLAGPGQVKGLTAAVPAHVSLADGEQTPIVVLLSYSSGAWRVCSSNLGGILPGPGQSSTPQPTNTAVTT